MTDCDVGHRCLWCHPRLALVAGVGMVVVYIGFLYVVFRWLP